MRNTSLLLDALRQEDALTANGALTNSTSLNYVLDMFFLAGASRKMSEKEIITIFSRAYGENPLLAISVLFWSRDCRGGAGEKNFFQTCMKYLREKDNKLYARLRPLIPEYGYWKDIFKVQDPTDGAINLFYDALIDNKDGLAAKYFPRKGAWFNALRKRAGMSPKALRKILVDLTNVVETKMCSKEWDSIEYSKVPSYAMNMYRKAFYKHDPNRFESFNQKVIKGEAKVNASVLFPNQLYEAYQRRDNHNAIKAQWMNLPNYLEGNKERMIPVCDVSGSMHGLPMSVSVALGVYISERNEGIFKDAFITFSGNPTLNYLKGDVIDRFKQLSSASWGMNTNLQAVFNLILNKAVKNNIPQEEMPTKILIISDMEFDSCVSGGTNYKTITSKYKKAGYELPNIVFWNVNGRIGNVPVNVKDERTALISGFSPSILTNVLTGENLTPLGVMMKTIDSKRYEPVAKIVSNYLK